MENELLELENDIRSLQADIAPLQTEYHSLLRQVAQNEAPSHAPNIPTKNLFVEKDLVPVDEQDEVPPVYHYNFFDESILKYFEKKDVKDSSHSRSIKSKICSQQILAEIEQWTANKNHLLVENIMRFGGVTAFPINDRLYDAEDCFLLGLRYDVMDHVTRLYVKPFYIILRRKRYLHDPEAEDTAPWQVFRYTTPLYVALDRYSALLNNKDREEGLRSFANSVHHRLVFVQRKKGLFSRVSQMTYSSLFKEASNNPIVIIEPDESYSHVLLSFSKDTHIELVCNDENIRDIKSSSSLQEYDSHIRGIATISDISQLVSAMERVFTFLRSKGLIRP